jgi:hypothetical protein
MTQLNEALDERKHFFNQHDDNEALKQELASVNAELTLSRHQLNNLQYRAFES